MHPLLVMIGNVNVNLTHRVLRTSGLVGLASVIAMVSKGFTSRGSRCRFYPLDRSGFLVHMDQNVRPHGNERTRKKERDAAR
jgi:hypothetical protein